ncbi:DUF2642 domain-containing protein [Fictibacillus halophilus]|uniref:DUF2642 domain-containing protein n=1 Tax=Fictibacillus halophilus TaxID=1610490 RepID=UPI001CF974C6|nr:DUF2642 domain-containing protein [Fictibacillus halophilus]
MFLKEYTKYNRRLLQLFHVVVLYAKPDHVVIQEHDSTFFVRLREIVWIMPES